LLSTTYNGRGSVRKGNFGGGYILEVAILEPKPCRRILEIKVPPERVKKEIEVLYQKYRQKARLPGFRKGRVPLELLRIHWGGRIEKEAIESLIPQAFSEALKNTNLAPLTEGVLEDLKLKEDKALDLKISFEVMPKISLKRYKGIPVEKEVKKIGNKEIEERLKLLQELSAEFVGVERPAQEGDYLILDYSIFDEQGRELQHLVNQPIELGKKMLPLEVEEGLKGVRPGEERKLEVILPYENSPDEQAGKRVSFWVKVKEVKEKHLPEINDEFVRGLGEYKDLVELKGKVEEDLIREEERRATDEVKKKIVQTLLEENQFEVPESMVEKFLFLLKEELKRDSRHQGKLDEEKFKENYRPLAVERVRRSMILEEIGRIEGIETSEEELSTRIEEIARLNKKSPSQVREILIREGSLERLKDEIREEKILDFLAKEAEYTKRRRFPLWV